MLKSKTNNGKSKRNNAALNYANKRKRKQTSFFTDATDQRDNDRALRTSKKHRNNQAANNISMSSSSGESSSLLFRNLSNIQKALIKPTLEYEATITFKNRGSTKSHRITTEIDGKKYLKNIIKILPEGPNKAEKIKFGKAVSEHLKTLLINKQVTAEKYTNHIVMYCNNANFKSLNKFKVNGTLHAYITPPNVPEGTVVIRGPKCFDLIDWVKAIKEIPEHLKYKPEEIDYKEIFSQEIPNELRYDYREFSDVEKTLYQAIQVQKDDFCYNMTDDRILKQTNKLQNSDESTLKNTIIIDPIAEDSMEERIKRALSFVQYLRECVITPYVCQHYSGHTLVIKHKYTYNEKGELHGNAQFEMDICDYYDETEIKYEDEDEPEYMYGVNDDDDNEYALYEDKLNKAHKIIEKYEQHFKIDNKKFPYLDNELKSNSGKGAKIGLIIPESKLIGAIGIRGNLIFKLLDWYKKVENVPSNSSRPTLP